MISYEESLDSPVERRRVKRTRGQKIRFWTKRVVKIFFISYVLGLFTMAALTCHHKHQHERMEVLR